MPPAGLLEVVAILGLLFVEEVGVPLPMFPADGLLVAGGVLAAGGAMPVWLLLPALLGVDMLGALAGYLWVRALRRRALQGPVARLQRSRRLRLLGDRLRRTGAPGVFLTRLVPGTRVYTTLAAGAIDLRPRSYLAGMLPASLLWVTGVTLLGTVIGSRALPLLARFESLSLDGLALLVAGLASYLALRHLPALARRRR
ncbi:MAG: DedA family protein, partial [Candidatus Dormibacteraceae bacterium]